MPIPTSELNDFVDAPTPSGPTGIASPNDFIDEPAAPPTRDVGMGESALRGAGQGLTLNYSDELLGLGKALFSDIKDTIKGKDTRGTFAQHYKAERDAERQANNEAREANPWTYGLSELGGGVASSVIPGLGIAKGAKGAALALQAGKLGGIAGFGATEAETLPEQLKDAGKSAVLSGATAGVMDRLLGGAPKRAAQRLVGDITDGVPATMRDRVVGKLGAKGATEANDFNGEVVQIMREKPIKAAGKDPNRLITAVDEALDETMAPIDAIFARAGRTTNGIKVHDVQKTMHEVVQDLEANPGTRGLGRAVKTQMDDVFESWVRPNTTEGEGFVMGDPTVTANQVRKFASAVGDNAFFGSPGVPPKAGKEVAQRVWGKLKDLIDTNVDEAASTLGGDGAKELRALNSRASTLIKMKQSLQYKATREATESTRLKDRVSDGLDIGLAVMNPTAFAAKKTFDWVGKPVARVADDKLATLVTAAKNGSTPAQLAERAIVLGLSPLVAQPLINWVQRLDNNLDQPTAP